MPSLSRYKSLGKITLASANPRGCAADQSECFWPRRKIWKFLVRRGQDRRKIMSSPALNDFRGERAHFPEGWMSNRLTEIEPICAPFPDRSITSVGTLKWGPD